MANSVGIRLNNIEEERVMGAMLAAGDENVSTHIKRVYFAALDRQDDYTDRISAELEQIQDLLQELQDQATDNANTLDMASLNTALANAASPQQELLLTLMSGMYRMLRQAVPYAIQRDADKVINIDAIEEYLKPTPHDDGSTTMDAIPDGTAQSSGSGGRRAKPLTPYALGKLQAQQEIAQRTAEPKSEVQKILWPDSPTTLVKRSNLATPVSQKPTFTQKVKQSFTR